MYNNERDKTPQTGSRPAQVPANFKPGQPQIR